MRFLSIFFVLIALACTFSGKTQPVNNAVGDVVLPSAEATSLGKFGEIPVSHFNGVPSISIPIYTVTQGPLSWSVSLSYHASGLRVAEVASWVGAGWALQAGAMISRSTVGIPDEAQNGWFFMANFNNLVLENVATGIQDSEPDVFNFSVPGYSGKFVYNINAQTNDTLQPMLIPRQNVRIIRLFNGGTHTGFKVIPPDGTVYYFGTTTGASPIVERSESRTNGVAGDGEVSGWYLVRIESHDGKHHINFTYEQESYMYPYPASAEHFSIIEISNCGVEGSSGTKFLNQDNTPVSQNLIEGYRLSKITNSGGTTTIDFIEEITNRLDVILNPDDPTNPAKALNYIEIKSGSFDKRFDFSHQYMQSPSDNLDIGGGNTNSPWYKRLQLLSVQELSIGGTPVVTNPYLFEYYTPVLPHRLSRQVDHWGFYNGQASNSNASVNVPPTKLVFPGGSAEIYGSANRHSSESHMRAGSLKKVTYPTKGYTEYNMGANRYYYEASESGFYMPKASVTTCYSQPDNICCTTDLNTSPSFNLTAGEIMEAEIDMDITLGPDIPGNCNGAPKTITLTIHNASSNAIEGTISWSEPASNPAVEEPGRNFDVSTYWSNLGPGNYYLKLSSTNGLGTATLKIQQAIEREVGGLRINTLSHYDANATLFDQSTFEYTNKGSSQSSGHLYVRPVYGTYYLDGSYYHKFYRDMSIVPLGTFDGYHIGYDRVVEKKSGQGETVYRFAIESRIPVTLFPQAPELFLVQHGRSDSVMVKHNNGTVLKSAANSYLAVYQNLPTQPLKLFYFKHVAQSSQGTIYCYYFNGLFYPIRTGYNLVDTTFDYADGVQSIRSWTYDVSKQLFPTSESIANSDGRVHRTEYQYATTYPTTTMRSRLKSQNRLLPAWETRKLVDGVLVDGQWNTFAFFGTTGDSTNNSATTNPLYPRRTYRYELTFDEAGTVFPGAIWKNQYFISKYQVDVGLPSEIKVEGWTDALKYQWLTNGRLFKWTFKDYIKEYHYHTNSDLLHSFEDIDNRILTYNWDELMRLKDVTNCQGVKVNLDYHYSNGPTNKNRITTSTLYPTLGVSVNKTLTNVTYTDGLGRPIQTVRHEQHPITAGWSIAEELVYNSVGRLIQKHEPLGINHTLGNYAAALTDFTLTTYETSMLERPVTVQPPSTGTLGRIIYTYGTNVDNDVFDYRGNVYYPAGKLFKTVMTDANGHETQEFKDILGRSILTRRKEGDGPGVSNTYTIYDNKNRPYQILPPGTNLTNSNLIFRKKYSGDDLVIWQDNPDQQPEFFSYDSRDLLIHRQDGNMRVKNHWYTIEYDGYGRPIREGFSSTTDGTVDEELITYQYGTVGITIDKVIRSTSKMLNGPGVINRNITFDNCGRVTNESRNSTVDLQSDTSCVMIYTWDSADNPITTTIRTPNGSDRLRILNTNEYDASGRMIRDKIKVNNNTETLLSQTEYTVKEQVSKLNLGPNAGSPLQTVDYFYLKNRLLKRINDPAALGGDQFGMRIYYDTAFTGSGITARKNGDISNIVWKTPSETNRQHYGFNYDYLDRLILADYSQYTGSAHTTFDRYNVNYQYDSRGNMTFVERGGANNASATAYGTIDDLTYHYYPGTNCIQNIEDDQDVHPYGYFENGGGNYLYDSSGNMTRDPSKKCNLYYNHLNKLDSIVLDNGTSVHFYHDAGGYLHQKSTRDAQGVTRDRVYFDQVELLNSHVDFIHHAYGYIHLLYAIPDELILSGTESMNNHNYQALKISSSRLTTGNKTITYTAGEIDMLQSFQVEDGSSVLAQVQNFTPVNLATTYVIRDHLGNNRVFFWDSTGNNSLSTNEIRAIKAYYPFGMDMRQPNNVNKEFKYGFANKEELEFTGYLEFGARCMDVTVGRFTSVDRFSEKFAFQTPSAYAACNPLKFIDVNGDSIRIATGNGTYAYYNNGEAQNSDGSRYTGTGTRVKKDGTIKLKGDLKLIVNALQSIETGGSAGNELINSLINSDKLTTVTSSAYNRAFNLNVEFNARDYEGGLDSRGNTTRPPFIALAHELAHALDYQQDGRVDNTVWFRINGKPVFNAEKFGSNYENRIRAEHGLPLRVNYSNSNLPAGNLLNGSRALYPSVYYKQDMIPTKKFEVIR